MNWQWKMPLFCLVILVLAAWTSTGSCEEVVYYHTDAQGSVVAVTDANGNVVERTRYSPYGETINRPLHDGPGYAGHETDATTGFTYMQQRYYDPTLGRFLSADPVVPDVERGVNFSRYWYANDNPYRFVDPDGRCVEDACIAEAWVAVAAVGAIYSAYRIIRHENEDASRPARPVPHKNQSEGDKGATNSSGEGNSNPYKGPVNEPVTVVDSNGNAIPVGKDEQITSSPDGKYQQVRDKDGRPTGTRLDKGGHKGQSDPKAQQPHAHRPGVTDESGNPHLPINEPKPKLGGH